MKKLSLSLLSICVLSSFNSFAEVSTPVGVINFNDYVDTSTAANACKNQYGNESTIANDTDLFTAPVGWTGNVWATTYRNPDNGLVQSQYATNYVSGLFYSTQESYLMRVDMHPRSGSEISIISIARPGYGAMITQKVFCTIPSDTEDHSITFNKPAVQSSTLSTQEASLAVDGDTGTTSSTALETAAWWQVNLEENIELSSVTISSGDEAPGNVEVQLLDSNFKVEQTYSLTSMLAGDNTFTFDAPVSAQYIKVINQGEGLLSLSEVTAEEYVTEATE